MKTSNTFLDVDDEILTKNLILSEIAGRAGNDDARQFDTKPFFLIQPSPGVCIKAKTDSEEKVFLNICTSDKIPEPDDEISIEDLFDTSSKVAITIPMSIGTERLEADKGGSPCPTYDVAINTSFFEKCRKTEHAWYSIICVIMEGVSDKFNKTLNTQNYVILKNRKAMGKIQEHRIENREPRNRPQAPKPLIEEVSSSRGINETKLSLEAVRKSQLKYVLCKQPAKGPVARLIGLFDMPKGITGKDVSVHIGTDRVVVTVDDTGLTYDLFLPYAIQVVNTKCFLDKDMKVLRLNMPVEIISDNNRD